MRAVLLGALVVADAVLISGAPARACEIPAACPDTYAAPAGGRVVPANAPALFFQRGDGPDDGSNGPVELVTGGGEALPFSLADDPANRPAGRLLIPAAVLPEGTIKLHTAACGPETGFFIDNTFTVVAASPMPTAIGALGVGPSAPVPVPSGLCDFMGLVRPVGVTLTLDPTPELEAFGALTQLTLTVDGAIWSRERYGRGASLGATADSVDLVYAECGTPKGGRAPRGVAPGRHHGELSAHVAGMLVDPPVAAFDFEIDCAAAPNTGITVGVDGGATDAVARPGAGAGGDGGGCRIGGGEAESMSAAIVMMGLFVVTLRTRRRLRRKLASPSSLLSFLPSFGPGR